MDWQIAATTNDRLGESPLWHPAERRLYWIDFYGPSVRRLDPATQRVETWQIPGAGSIGSLAFAREGKLVLALDHKIVMFDPATSIVAPWTDPKEGRTDLAYNDAKIDRSGRYWVGTFDVSERDPKAAFYRVAADGAYEIADRGFVVTNGPSFSPDGRVLYFSDSMARQMLAYDIEPRSGRLSGKRIFAKVPEGLTDGMTVDSDGHVWCAVYGAGLLIRFRPDGSRAEALEVPARYVTSCALGGDDLCTLYVTSGIDAEKGQNDRGGSLLSRHVECPGLPEPLLGS
jgi:sugar lactone lactonase YvrE